MNSADTLAATTASGYAPALHRLTDLEVPLAVRLGHAVLPVRDVLKITSGTVIELDRRVSENVDLMVYGKLVARGEIVSVKGNYGVRVTEVLSQQDRLAVPE